MTQFDLYITMGWQLHDQDIATNPNPCMQQTVSTTDESLVFSVIHVELIVCLASMILLWPDLSKWLCWLGYSGSMVDNWATERIPFTATLIGQYTLQRPFPFLLVIHEDKGPKSKHSILHFTISSVFIIDIERDSDYRSDRTSCVICQYNWIIYWHHHFDKFYICYPKYSTSYVPCYHCYSRVIPLLKIWPDIFILWFGFFYIVLSTHYVCYTANICTVIERYWMNMPLFKTSRYISSEERIAIIGTLHHPVLVCFSNLVRTPFQHTILGW